MHGSLSCQLTAVRPLPCLGDAIYLRRLSLTKQTPTAVAQPPLSRAGPAKNVSSKKKHRTCLTHMPSQWIRGSSRQTHRRWPAPNQGSLSLGARAAIVSHPSRGARARPWVSSQSLVLLHQPGYKIMSQARRGKVTAGTPHDAADGAMSS